MKFRFYLISLLAISALISCTKDDDPGIEVPDMTPDATFSLAVENLQTKALAEGAIDPKDRITKLSVIVYIGDDYYTMKDSVFSTEQEKDPKATLLEVKDIPVKGGNVKILVLANAANSTAFKDQSLADALKIKTSGLQGEKHSQLTMSSGVISTTLGVSVHNYLGYNKSDAAGIKVCSKEPVKLYRNVGRIQLSGLTLQKKTDFGEAVSFKLKKIYLANVKNHSYLASQQEWGSVEVASEAVAGFWSQGILGDKGEYNKNTYDYSVQNNDLLYDFTTSHTWNDFTYYDENTNEEKPMSNIMLGFTDGLKSVCNNFQTADNVVFPIGNFFYAYENKAIAPGAQTMLILCGDYTYIPTGSTEEKTNENTIYPFVINETGADVPGDLTAHKGIMRNTKYSLSLTIKGPGSPTADPDSRAYLGAKVTVKKWGLIEINDKVD